MKELVGPLAELQNPWALIAAIAISCAIVRVIMMPKKESKKVEGKGSGNRYTEKKVKERELEAAQEVSRKSVVRGIVAFFVVSGSAIYYLGGY